MSHRTVNPDAWPHPRGYSNGILSDAGRLLAIAGQIGWNERAELVSGDFTEQAIQALHNVLAVLHAAGGAPEHLVRMTWYVTDIVAYRAQARDLGAVWREIMGRNFPAMAVVGATALVEPQALVEIEATAILPA